MSLKWITRKELRTTSPVKQELNNRFRIIIRIEFEIKNPGEELAKILYKPVRKENTTMASNGEDYERVLLVKPTVYVYKIPPLMSASRGFRAADWNLAQPDWTGRLRVISKGNNCFLRIEDCNTGQLYCQAPVLAYPGPQVQPVADSRRYFVVKVVSDTGRTALIGIGFADGADSFDLSVALQDFFTTLENESKASEPTEDRPKLDLALKGDIRVNLNIGGQRTVDSTAKSRPRSNESNNSKQPFFLPPPPGSKRK